MDKRLVLLISFFISHRAVAGSDAGIKNPLYGRIILPIQDPAPLREPTVDYSIYKAHALWPDWDWAEEAQECTPPPPTPQESTSINSPSTADPQSPLSECIVKLRAYFTWFSK